MNTYEIRYMKQIKGGVRVKTDRIEAVDARSARDEIESRDDTVSITSVLKVRSKRYEL